MKLNVHRFNFGLKEIATFGLIAVLIAAWGIMSVPLAQRADAIGEVTCTATITSETSIATTFNAMIAGETLCLKGSFTTGPFTLTASGVTLASEPGQTAQIFGKINLNGDNMKVLNLAIDGQGNNSGTLLVYNGADDNLIQGNNITSTAPDPSAGVDVRQGNCIIVGESGATSAIGPKNTIINANRIHNCGNGKYDQGLYILGAQSTLIRNNFVYDNPMFGMQLYPDSDEAIIEYNTFDNNAAGITFSGEGSKASDHNTFRNNIVSNSTNPSFNNINYYWGGTVGTTNVTESNCLFNGTPGNFQTPYTGYSVAGTNVLDLDPLYTDRATKDFKLLAESPCTSMGPRDDISLPPPPPPPPAQDPFPIGSSFKAIPGTIQFEDYDNGGQGVAYNDTTSGNAGAQYRTDDVDIYNADGGKIVGSTAAGEWLEFTSNTQSGRYNVSVRYSSTQSGSLRLTLNGATIAAISLASTGNVNTYKTVTVKNVNISAASGKILRAEIVSNPVNLNNIVFTKTR